MRNFVIIIIVGLLMLSCTRQGQINVFQESAPQKNMQPRINIKNEGIEIRNSIDTIAYSNYDVIINDIYSARLLRKPEINMGNSIEIPYNLFDLPPGSVISSLIFRIPNYNDYIITQEIPPRGELSGFLDIEWGSNTSTARKVLEDRGFTEIYVYNRAESSRLDTEEITKAREAWANQKYITARGEFAGMRNARITLEFYYDKFFHAIIEYQNSIQYSSKGFYVKQLYNLLSERYWNTIVNESGRQPIYRWIFDNKCYIQLIENSSTSYVSAKLEYIEQETYNAKEKFQSEIFERIRQENEDKAKSDL